MVTETTTPSLVQHPWISAEAPPPTTGEDEGMATGDREEDLLPEEMYPPQDMEAPPDASTVGKKDTMHATVPKRNSYPTIRENKPISLIWKKKNRTMKCRMPKNLTQWQQSVPN